MTVSRMVVTPFEPEVQEDDNKDEHCTEMDVDEEIGLGHQKVSICCSLTKQPFQEPVVHRRGLTFEQDAIQEQFVDLICYPNRALKEYLDPTTNSSVELQANNTNKKGTFCCPITCDLLRDPVIDPEGNTFERHAIVAWIKQHGVSPITRKPLQMDQLYDNTTLLTVLLHEVQQADETLNPEEIEEWKREVSRVPRAEPPLSASQLQAALSSVPNPSLAAIREALNTPESTEELAPEQNLSILQTIEDPIQPRRPPSPTPLLLQELQQVQEEEAEQRHLSQEADLHLDVLCRRHRVRIALFMVGLAGGVAALFLILMLVANLSAIFSLFITCAMIVCCCFGMGQYSTCV